VLDLDRGKQDVAASRAALISGDEALLQAREEFGRALGSATPLGVPSALDLEQLERAVARTCRLNEDVERRPDVAAARKKVELADRAIHDAQLMIAPSLSASSTVNYASAASLAPNTTWNVQGVVNVPFYDGGVRYGLLRDAAPRTNRRARPWSRRGSTPSSRLRARTAPSAFRVPRARSRSPNATSRRASMGARGRDTCEGFGTSLDLVISAQALRQAEIDLAVQDLELGEARAGAVLANAECIY